MNIYVNDIYVNEIQCNNSNLFLQIFQIFQYIYIYIVKYLFKILILIAYNYHMYLNLCKYYIKYFFINNIENDKLHFTFFLIKIDLFIK